MSSCDLSLSIAFIFDENQTEYNSVASNAGERVSGVPLFFGCHDICWDYSVKRCWDVDGSQSPMNTKCLTGDKFGGVPLFFGCYDICWDYSVKGCWCIDETKAELQGEQETMLQELKEPVECEQEWFLDMPPLELPAPAITLKPMERTLSDYIVKEGLIPQMSSQAANST